MPVQDPRPPAKGTKKSQVATSKKSSDTKKGQAKKSK